MPISFHMLVLASRAKNRPGGFWLRMRSTICLATSIFCFFVRLGYVALLAAIRSRNFRFPLWRMLLPPLPHSTSLSCGLAMLHRYDPCSVVLGSASDREGSQGVDGFGATQERRGGWTQLMNGVTNPSTKDLNLGWKGTPVPASWFMGASTVSAPSTSIVSEEGPHPQCPKNGGTRSGGKALAAFSFGDNISGVNTPASQHDFSIILPSHSIC